MTKELKQIDKALKAYYDKYDGNIVINASVFALDDNGKPIGDDHIWNSGSEWKQLSNLEIMMEEWKKQYNNNIY